MTIAVREARESEIDEIVRLLGMVFEGVLPPRGAPLDPAYPEAFARYLGELVDVRGRLEDAELFVAASDGLIIGTGTLYPPGMGRQYASAVHAKTWPDDWASLRLLAVHPAHRRKGIGQMLLDARIRRARELGASFVALHTSEEFATARRLFRRSGWSRRPEFDHAPVPGVRAEAYVLPLR